MANPYEPEDRARSLLEQITAHLPGMVFQYRRRPDGSGCFPFASEGIRSLLHASPEDVREDAGPAFIHVHPDDLTALRASIEQSALSGKPWRQRFRVQTPHTPLRWLEGNAAPQHDADGSCLWHGFITDITQSVAAEENLRIAASVFSNAQEGITITDAGGFIADVNPAFTRITGYTRDEVLGRTPRLLSSGHQDGAFYQQLWKTLQETGSWRGEIWNRHKSGEVYPELLSISAVRDHAGQISHYVGTFFDITRIKEREAHLDRIAHYDPLTGLPNRRLLDDRLEQAVAQIRRSGKIVAICLLDLDNFKPINDELGHEAGDAVLVEVARRLTANVREFDTVARIGGDEFVLLLLNLDWMEECDGILSRLLREITAVIEIDGHPLQVSASIGVTVSPHFDIPPDVCLKHADHAMYQAKRAGRNRYKLFDPEHDRLVGAYRRLVEELTLALERDEFVFHYQPKVHLTASMVVGVEALIRWRHPQRGLLAPAEFIEVIAQAGLQISLDTWVIDHALKQLSSWKAHDLHLPISINLSPDSLLDTHFALRLAEALARHPDLSGADLEIEIPESAELASGKQATLNIQACQALGIRVALDDFGTRSSSPAEFRRLPVDVVKIAPWFIREMCNDPENLAIVEGVLKIARGFKREVIAKGVENSEQMTQLKQLGCHLVQGYAIARPMPAEHLVEWLTTWSNE